MTSYTLAEAKANFSKVIEEVMAGHSALITKYGHPAAVIAPPEKGAVAPKRQLYGCLSKEFAGWQLPEDFDRMAQEEIIALFEGAVR
jgi:prevent-host-death family protein